MADAQSTSSAEVEGYVWSPSGSGQHTLRFAPVPEPGTASQGAVNDKSSRWSARDDCVLCDALIEQMLLGRKNRDTAVFTLEAWNAVADRLRGSEAHSGGSEKTVTQCKARWQRLKIEYRTVKHIRQQPGFSWDENTSMLTALAATWDAYIAGHRDAQPWRKKGFPAYNRVAYLIEDEHGQDAGEEKFMRRWNNSAQTSPQPQQQQQESSISTPVPTPAPAPTVLAPVPAPTISAPLTSAPPVSAPSAPPPQQQPQQSQLQQQQQQKPQTLTTSDIVLPPSSTSVFSINGDNRRVNARPPPFTTVPINGARADPPAFQTYKFATQTNGKRGQSPVTDVSISKRPKSAASSTTVVTSPQPQYDSYPGYPPPPPPGSAPGHPYPPPAHGHGHVFYGPPPPHHAHAQAQAPHQPHAPHTPQANSPIPVQPTRLAIAIQCVETSEGLPDTDFVKAVQLFQRRNEAADAYLAIQNKRARSLYLRAELDDFGSS
ncbi:uncharacterized protein FOMMEDRAFT_165724 [Fomitiporia mediterranea MF3/22]|uniref:uncharacterized protein n=1 Tax=Fomitiporia mediterranea (strain MF3/22) TaxID=694068 RepID=UPI000440812A|nr:uncharacterized protein FOMMEDRAFT_165724 [Fomitiporia mediterranea MF3/22]EJD07120.1 hypothetical protein FOMMEDRAFT_165724 [Fomitiporia mediterranea MF3/22]